MTTTHQPKSKPQGRRAKPGSQGGGNFYHIEIRPRTDFQSFRTQDVGRKGGIERVAGRRKDGSWDTQKWLVAKALAHIERRRLVPDNEHARKVLAELGSKPVQIEGDRFKASSLRKGTESKKTAPAQHRIRKRGNSRAQTSA